MEEQAAQKEKPFLTGRQAAWMIYEYFRVSDTDESVLDLNVMLKVELKNDNEDIIAMKEQPGGEILAVLFSRQLQQSEQ